MSEVDFSQYRDVSQIVEDIKSIKIQGATNVAIATFEGIKLFIRNYQREDSHEIFMSQLEQTGLMLANARPNEPLAKNGLKFLVNMLRIKYPGEKQFEQVKERVAQLADEYLQFIKSSKERIVENSMSVFNPDIKGILTHCHSSTAEKVIGNHNKNVEGLQVVCTETRPLFQGRTTAKNLVAMGVDTTMVADSAAESFIVGRGTFPVDMIFIGCDQITMQGDAINKIGSWGVALASYFASKPIYVVGSILKTDVSTVYKPVEIEMRESKELWEEAPEGLKLLNPAFEIVNKQFITGYITEVGVIKPDEIARYIQLEYQWLF